MNLVVRPLSQLDAGNGKAGGAILQATMLVLPTDGRSRALYAASALVLALLAFASRHYNAVLPVFIVRYAGDTLWAGMVYFATRAVLARATIRQAALIAITGSYAVEVSQLYHAPWIDGIRGTWLGGVVLGHGFLWSDIACYTVGVALGVVVDLALVLGWRHRGRAPAAA